MLPSDCDAVVRRGEWEPPRIFGEIQRLGEIFDKGLVGIQRDYAESLKWYNAARVLGEDVPMAKSR